MVASEIILLVVHFTVLALLSIYGAHRYHLAYLSMRYRNDEPETPKGDFQLPKVTIQLPVFNERFVIERLIDSVCKINYPRELLEIQVLDDSTDDTTSIARSAVARWRARGVEIAHIHRTDRTGFKAGALEAGTRIAHGEFIAIFDADFLPTADFLEKTIPHFVDPQIGMVQARWAHINRNYSLITRAQGIFLDGHFLVEHLARNRSGKFFNFNGTAGIWRRSCIMDAGGWHHETLTEDLDLSYRAQLRGWRFIFLKDLTAPAELPVDLNAFKTQQHRWAKGSIQVALKLLPTIWKSDVPWPVKLEAVLHLTNNFAYVLMLIMSILMPVALQIRIEHGWHHALLVDVPVFMGATVSVCGFYILSQIQAGAGWWRRIVDIPFVLAVGIGLAVNNTRAVIEACVGYRTPFARTPKLALDDQSSIPGNQLAYRGKLTLTPVVEIMFGLVYVYSATYCVQLSVWTALPFMVLFAVGFLYLGCTSLIQGVFIRRRTRSPVTSQPTA